MATIRIGSFEWDSEKAASNLRKHRVGFDEAMGCFADPRGLELADLANPNRLILIAFSEANRILTVVYAERSAGAILRIISARRATPHEKKTYENES